MQERLTEVLLENLACQVVSFYICFLNQLLLEELTSLSFWCGNNLPREGMVEEETCQTDYLAVHRGPPPWARAVTSCLPSSEVLEGSVPPEVE